MKAFTCILVCLSLVVAGAIAKGISLPKEIETCKRGDDACLSVAIEKALRFFAPGNARLGMVPIDPLHVSEMLLDQGSGPVSIKLTLKEQDILGIAEVQDTRVTTEMNNETYMLEIQGVIPKLVLIGDYNIEGKILVLPIRGAGKNNLTLTDFKAKFVLNGHVIKKHGEEYVSLDKVKLTIDISRLYIDLQNLFNGDKAVGDNMAVFLNDNWQVIFHELKPSIEEALNILFKEICLRIYNKVPYALMHPRQ